MNERASLVSAASAPSTHELGVLLAGEMLELYQSNPFRILNLPSDASLAQAQKRVQKLNVLRQMGESKSDEFAVREALQMLRDPQKRLLAELFWFQTEGHEVHARAMVALRTGKWQEARDLWKHEYQSQKSSASGRQALHNLAVLIHASVVARETSIKNNFTAYLSGNKPMPAEHLNAWREAFQAWSAYLNTPSAWDFWRDRARAIADRRLSPDFVDQLRALLPEVLLQVNRDLARRYAENGYGYAAGQHCQIIAHSGFDERLCVSLCRTVLEPIKKRVLQKCESVAEQIDNCRDPQRFSIVEYCQSVQAELNPDLTLMGQVDAERLYGSRVPYEKFAQILLRCGHVAVFDKRDERGEALLRIALNYADSQVLRDEINEVSSAATRFLQIWRMAPRTCLLCRQEPADYRIFEIARTYDERLIFLCATHNQPQFSRLVEDNVNQRWELLPRPPYKPQRFSG